MTALASQYKAGISMLAQTNVRRTATARFFITLVSGLFGLLTIISRQEQLKAKEQAWLNPGKIEQYVPLVMMLPALILLLATHWK